MLHPKEKIKPPRSLRTARLSVVKNKISTPFNLPAVKQSAIITPKKVIKALYDYQAQDPRELSFSRGDFFHVTDREGDPNWYEACNPVTNLRGFVPANYFQALEKSESTSSAQKADSGFVDSYVDHGIHTKKMQPLYGIVLYDFEAERSDELDAKAGEPIIVIAKSNEEWFVAKPIGRLGGPGLIPVSFVEIRDAVTGKAIDQNQAATAPVPRVEEWKKITQGYEATSITLGSFDKPCTAPPASGASPSSSIYSARSDRLARTDPTVTLEDDSYHSHSHSYTHEGYTGYQTKSVSRDAAAVTVVDASIDSYILEGDQYWFIVYARLSNGRFRVLYRLYEDFYDFQISLLQDFPVEAGKGDRERTLPYMPGPLTTVDEEITSQRQIDLDNYCRDLLSLPREISESDLVQTQLFGIHEGDIETDYDPRTGMLRPNDEDHVTQPFNTTAAVAPAIVASKEISTIKVKIVHKDDIFAIKVPTDCSLEKLRAKIHDRLGIEKPLKYKAGAIGETLQLQNEADMKNALEAAVGLGKLTVYAKSD